MLFSPWIPEAWKTRLRRRAGAVTTADRLANLRAAGFAPRRIIDAGAYRGEWTRLAHGIFSAAEILMIEPQPQLQPILAEICVRLPKVRHQAVALGERSGTVHFRLWETNSSVVPAGTAPPAGGTICEVPMETLERVAQARGWTEVDFLKLDLQGHELRALAGAGALFGQIEAILIEVSVLQIGNVPRVDEVWDAMRRRGYRLYDVFGCNYRPRDRALWQCDLIFVREDSPLVSSREWS